jgi:putative transposase
MIDPKHPKLSVSCQCGLLGLARSTAYYRPVGPSKDDLELMRRIDELYTKWPFLGSRQMKRTLRREGIGVGRKRVRRLMREMGLQAQCPKPNLSKPAPGNKIYPYLMRAVTIDRPNQAWCADITYIRLDTGFVYLVAIMDWHSRYVLDWELSNSLDAAFCCSALERAIARYGPPQICNTDQGGQFTGERWTGLLREHRVRISMDGRGRALDNVFVERLWRSLKYEEVYRREYAGLADARTHIAEYFRFYNHHRPHSSLGERTPAEVFAAAPERKAA